MDSFRSMIALVGMCMLVSLAACTGKDGSPPATAEVPQGENEAGAGTGAEAPDDEPGPPVITMALSWGRNKKGCAGNGICTLDELGAHCPYARYIPDDRKVIASARLSDGELRLELASPPPSRDETIFIDDDIPLSECASRALGATAVLVRSGEYAVDYEAGGFGHVAIRAIAETAEMDPADAESAPEASAEDADAAAEDVDDEDDDTLRATKHCFCRASMNAHGGLVNWGSLSDVCLSWQIPLNDLPGYKGTLSKTKKESLCNTWCSTQAASDVNFNDDAWVCKDCRPKCDNPGNMVAYSKIGTTWPATSAWSAAQTNVVSCCPAGGGIQCPEGWLPDGNGPGNKKCKRLACLVPEPCPPSWGSLIGVTVTGFPPKVDSWGFTWGCEIWQWGPALSITPIMYVPCPPVIIIDYDGVPGKAPAGPVPTVSGWHTPRPVLRATTPDPNVTAAPNLPAEPVATQPPDATREPDDTAVPDVTPVPDVTREPDVTPVPDVTETPPPPPPPTSLPATRVPPVPPLPPAP